MSLSLASIHVYPIKSLGGFTVDHAQLTDRGLEHDRRWMLVDEQGVFVTQREVPGMACLHTEPMDDGFRVTDLRTGHELELPWVPPDGPTRMSSVWSDRVRMLTTDVSWSAWFSDRLERDLNLVFMPDATRRQTDGRYARGINSLSDGFPYLIVSQASLDDLNARGMARAQEQDRTWSPVPMDRFRPNLVIAGGTAFQEDGWKEVAIGQAHFRAVKPCARCVIITTDQRSGDRYKEPLRTLATYRTVGNKLLFGMNALEVGARHGDDQVMVRVGDLVIA